MYKKEEIKITLTVTLLLENLTETKVQLDKNK